MEINKILSADLLDLLFDGRNKDYGAYELRKTYSKRVSRALLITGSIVAVVFTGVAIASNSTIIHAKEEKGDIIVLTEIPPDQPLPLEEPEPPAPEQTRTEAFTAEIKIVEVVEDPLPTTEDLARADIDVKKTDGDTPDGTVTLEKPDGVAKGVIEEKPIKEEGVVGIVQVQASYDGWEKFLLKNLRAEVPVDNGAPSGRHTVIIEFVVDVDGSVSDIKALTHVGFGMEEESIRVIKKSKKWIPAFNYDKHVKAYRRQSITFEVLSDE